MSSSSSSRDGSVPSPGSYSSTGKPPSISASCMYSMKSLSSAWSLRLSGTSVPRGRTGAALLELDPHCWLPRARGPLASPSRTSSAFSTSSSSPSSSYSDAALSFETKFSAFGPGVLVDPVLSDPRVWVLLAARHFLPLLLCKGDLRGPSLGFCGSSAILCAFWLPSSSLEGVLTGSMQSERCARPRAAQQILH
eukprot:CAMPEP_0179088476 /NCGR_PEP_ID=MMETSP0796-20121207/40259_1 /TAXON_ID=73915 /ORGANISM="Pyrodinium bahamense, Strain pbaha01" /LENGTH=193 /DNA_ID=CAMNT_0020786007 /DNA_START=396 /DNA_END=974 /DNA_ORIENTATION=+